MVKPVHSMPVSNQYLDFVLDQLNDVGPVVHKRMFGGVGLYYDGLFFGLIDDDVLYFKVDETTRGRYEAARSRPFQPYGDGSYSMSYYSVPAGVLEDQEELSVWVQEAVAVSAKKTSKRATKGKPKR
jgi:DNA transformation protein